MCQTWGDRSNVNQPIMAIRLLGPSGSGKTTLGVKLAHELAITNGLRVAVVKTATRHSAPKDSEGRDSWRYAQSPTSAVAAVFSDEVVIRLRSDSVGFQELLRMLSPVADMVLVEGLRDANLPTIVVSHGDLVEKAENGTVIAIVSDRVRPDAPHVLHRDDVAAITNRVLTWMDSQR